MATKSAYESSAREIGELFDEYVEGDANRPVLTVSTEKLGGVSRNAIEKSLLAFGYRPNSCTFAAIGNLDRQAVFLLVEGLDPLYVIATDRKAVSSLSQAYRTNFPTDSFIRVFGRCAIAFDNLDELMQTPESKQRAWALLKTLFK